MVNPDCVESLRKQSLGLSVEFLDWVDEVGRPTLNVDITIQWTGLQMETKGGNKFHTGTHQPAL